MKERSPSVITVRVRNHSTVVQRADMARAFPVFLRQANNDLHKYWNHHWKSPHDPHVPFVDRIAELRAGHPWPTEPETWRATIYDFPFQAMSDDDVKDMPVEALRTVGYHFVHDDRPHLIVYAGLAQQAGLPWTLTFSHELLECLVDPRADGALEIGNDTYELEICDPVQFQAYPIDGVWVSNFVTPAWFQLPPAQLASSPDDPYDFARQLVSPRQRSLGGARTLRVRGREKTETLTGMGSVDKT
jgi:hypothetical protein